MRLNFCLRPPAHAREAFSLLSLCGTLFLMHYTKFLKWGVILGLVLVLFTPFIVAGGGLFPSMFFPFITGKNFAFRILVEVVLGLYIILAIREAKYRPKSSWLMWSVGAFVAWMAIATLLSVDPVKSFWGNFERMDGYINTIHLFFYFIVTGAMLTAERWWEKYFQISISASVLQAFYALSQVFHWFGLSPSSQSGVRADGTFGNATYLAVYMLFNFFITLLLTANVLKEKNALKRNAVLLSFYASALVLQFFSLFFTETRGTILGLVGGLVVAALYVAVFGRTKEMKLMRRISFGVLGVIAIATLAFFALKDTNFVRTTPALSRLASISLEDKTTMSRFIIWDMALQGAKEKPLTGWGQENFNFVFNKYYNPAMYNQEQWFDRAHNEFLDWLIAGGVLAFLLYVSFFALATWAIYRAKELSVGEQAALIGVLAGYAFNNLFVFDNLVSLFYFYLVLAFVHSVSKQQLPRLMFLSRPGNDRMVAVAAPVVAVMVFGGMWMLNAPGLTRAQVLIDALQSQNPRTGATYTVEDHLVAFERSLASGELGRQETVEQLFQFASNSVAPSTALGPDVKQKVYDLTRQAGQELQNQRRDDARLELFMGVFYSQFGQPQNAIAEFTNALKHSPNKQQILFQTGVTYLQLGDTQNATTLFKKAFELEPSYNDARILYASSLYYSKDIAGGDKLLTDGFGTVVFDDNRLLQTYMQTKQYDRAVGIWNKRIEASPKDANTLLGLAGAYFQMGNKAQTIATIRKVMEIDPASKAQMESLIKQIEDGTLKVQ